MEEPKQTHQRGQIGSQRLTFLFIICFLTIEIFHLFRIFATLYINPFLPVITNDNIISVVLPVFASVAAWLSSLFKVRREPKSLMIALFFFLPNFYVAVHLSTSIIVATWSLCLALVLGLAFYIDRFHFLRVGLLDIDKTMDPQYQQMAVRQAIDEVKFLFDKIFIGVIALATYVATMMTILWTGWAQAGGVSHESRGIMAVDMLLAFSGVMLIVIIYAGVPLLKIYEESKAKIVELGKGSVKTQS